MVRCLLCVAVFAAACEKGGKPPPPSTGNSTVQETGPRARNGAAPRGEPSEAERLFMTVCATCHGPEGRGDGPASDSLNPKPRDYSDKAWQASVTDDDLRNIIVNGGQAVGKSAMMPANPQLKNQPEVVTGLVRLIRGFGGK